MSERNKQEERLKTRSDLQELIANYIDSSLGCGFSLQSTADDIADVIYDASEGKISKSYIGE